jgi:hypothetical protein
MTPSESKRKLSTASWSSRCWVTRSRSLARSLERGVRPEAGGHRSLHHAAEVADAIAFARRSGSRSPFAGGHTPGAV